MRRAVALSRQAGWIWGAWSPAAMPFSSRLRSKVAGPPREDDEGDDQENDNRHPILQLNAEYREFLNKKLHRAAPLLCNVRRLVQKTILFLYD
jgi:hypothetical protein